MQHPEILEAIFAGGLHIAIDERDIGLLEGHVVPHPRLGHLTDEVQGEALGPSELPDDVVAGIKTHQLNGSGYIKADGRGV